MSTHETANSPRRSPRHGRAQEVFGRVGNGVAHRFVAGALMPVLLSSAGCYSAVSDWKGADVQRPTATPSIAYGTGLEVQREADADASGALAVQVNEVALCRSYEVGTVYSERTRSVSQDTWPFTVGLSLGILGVTSTVAGAILQNVPDFQSTGATMLPVGVVGLVAAAAFLVPYFILPSARTEKDDVKVGPYKQWHDSAKACGPVQPYAKATQVTLDLKNLAGTASIATWTLPTDATGKLRSGAIATAQRIASYCGSSTLLVSDASPAAETSDTPDAPQLVQERHGAPLSIPLAPMPTKPTLAAMAIDDPTAVGPALLCCTEEVKRDTEPKCVTRCLEAAGAVKCLNGMRACDVQAKAGEFVDDGLAQCGQLLSVCLSAHGSGASQLATCKSMCAAKNASEVCK